MGFRLSSYDYEPHQIADAVKGSDRLLAALRTHHDFDMRIPEGWVPPPKPEEPILPPPPERRWFTLLPQSAYPKIRDIQWAVADYYKVDATDLLSARRTWDLVRPRQVAYYLCKKLTLKSLPEIGRKFGRDHTTILYGVRLVAKNRAVDEKLNQDIHAIAEQFGGLHENAA